MEIPDQLKNYSGIVSSTFDDITPNDMLLHKIMLNLTDIARCFNEISAENLLLIQQELTVVAYKLRFMWTHIIEYRDHFERHKQDLPLIVILGNGMANGHTIHSPDLYKEFDEFLVQFKSCLDCLAKLPRIWFGQSWGCPRSFGDKGRKIIRIAKSLPDQYKCIVPKLEELLFSSHSSQLFTYLIDLRDQFNHQKDGGIPTSKFELCLVDDGTVKKVKKPCFGQDETSLDFVMEEVFFKLVEFVERFYAITSAPMLRQSVGWVNPWGNTRIGQQPSIQLLEVEIVKAFQRDIKTRHPFSIGCSEDILNPLTQSEITAI